MIHCCLVYWSSQKININSEFYIRELKCSIEYLSYIGSSMVFLISIKNRELAGLIILLFHFVI